MEELYKNLVLKFIVFDLTMGRLLILFSIYLIWLGIKNIHKATNPKIFFTFCIGILLMGILYFYSIRMRFFDYFKYLRTGDSYLKTKTCKVTDTMWITLSFIIFGNEDIKCNDGNWYYIRYQRSYQKEIRKGRIFKITFLPKQE